MPLMYFQMTVILFSRGAYKNMRSGPHIVLEDRLFNYSIQGGQIATKFWK